MNLDMFLLGHNLGRLNLYIKQFRQLNEAQEKNIYNTILMCYVTTKNIYKIKIIL